MHCTTSGGERQQQPVCNQARCCIHTSMWTVLQARVRGVHMQEEYPQRVTHPSLNLRG
jgi:hypothetical protein